MDHFRITSRGSQAVTQEERSTMAHALTRRRFLQRTLSGATGLLVGSLLTACQGSATSNTPTPGTSSSGPTPSTSKSPTPAQTPTRTTSGAAFSGKLTVWGVVSFTKEGDQLLGQQMVDWGKQHNVQVEYNPLPGSDYLNKVAAAVEAKALPDIVMMENEQAVYYAAQGHLVDLTDVYNELKGLAGGIYETLLPYCTVDNKVYAIPMQADVSVMYARLDLCEKATEKREPPKTLDALEEIARKVQSPPTLYGIGFVLGRTPDGQGNMTQLLFADGGLLVNEKGEPALDSPATVAALERLQRWWKDKLIPPDSISADDAWNNKMYQSGQAAFVFNPASIYAYLEKNDPQLLSNTAQAPFPDGKGKARQSAGTWSWAIAATSKNIEAAKALLLAIMQPDKIEQVYEKVGGRWYPVYRDLANAPFWKQRPYFDLFPQIIANSQPGWAPAPASPKLLAQLSAFNQRFVLSDMAQDVLINNKSPQEAVKAAQSKMEQIFQDTAKSLGG